MSNAAFSETIEKKATFCDGKTGDNWGERPLPEDWFDEPWENWKDIPDEILDRCGDYMLIMTPFKAILFYLAAYMRFTLKEEIEVNFVGCFGTSTLGFIGGNYERLEELKLTDRQIKFIRDFIKFFIHDFENREWINLHRKKPLSKNDFL